MQFQVGASLMAGVTDNDGTVSNIRWKWYRSSSKTSMGTAIEDATDDTYTVQDRSTDNDVGMYIHAVATYSDRRESNKIASSHFGLPGAGGPGRQLTTGVRLELRYQAGDRGEEGHDRWRAGHGRRTPTADVLNYTLAGDDAGHFEIDQSRPAR